MAEPDAFPLLMPSAVRAVKRPSSSTLCGPVRESASPARAGPWNHRASAEFAGDRFDPADTVAGGFDRYELGRLLGEGSFASARLARGTASGRIVGRRRFAADFGQCVVKTTSVVNRAKPRAALFSLREALALTYLPPHNNIPALLDFVAGPKETHLILDLAPGEELFNYVNSTALGRLGEAETRAIVVGILEALRHAHENGVVHRDVKLDNVFWDPVSQKVSLLDFGLATFFEDGTTCTEPLGCINYASPQLLRLTNTGVPYGAARGWSDLWALGILTHGLLTGYFPFRAEEPIELEREIRETWMNASELEGVPAREVSRECRHFLHTILNPANEGLLTAADLLAHPWLASLASTAPVVHTSSPFPRLPSSTNDLRRQARLVADELQARLPAFRMKMARLLVPGWQPTPFFLSPDHAASLPSRTPSPASSIETAIMDIDRNAEFDSTKSRGPLFSGLSFKSSAPSSSFSSITSVSSTASKTSAVRKWFSRLAGKQ